MSSELDGQNPLLEHYREYLSLLARLQMDRRLQGKIDLSGVVQLTLLEAYRAFPRLNTNSPSDTAAWLRRILANNLADEIRKLNAAKRNVGREQSLEAALEASSTRLEAFLAVDESSPSQKVSRQEDGVRLAKALCSLPDAQREALELQHWHGLKVDEIAEQMGKSRTAVAGLIKRGLENLRKTITDER